MYLQVWNGIEINSTTFGRTVEWRGGVPCLRENFPPETFAHENYGQGFNVSTHITQCIMYHPRPPYPIFRLAIGIAQQTSSNATMALVFPGSGSVMANMIVLLWNSIVTIAQGIYLDQTLNVPNLLQGDRQGGK